MQAKNSSYLLLQDLVYWLCPEIEKWLLVWDDPKRKPRHLICDGGSFFSMKYFLYCYYIWCWLVLGICVIFVYGIFLVFLFSAASILKWWAGKDFWKLSWAVFFSHSNAFIFLNSSKLEKRSKEVAQRTAMEEAELRRSSRVRAPPRDNPSVAFRKYNNKWKED